MSFNREGLGFNPSNKKKTYKGFFIKETTHEKFKSCSVPKKKQSNLLNIKVTLLIKGDKATFIPFIKVV